jgi:hypothetical protein
MKQGSGILGTQGMLWGRWSWKYDVGRVSKESISIIEVCLRIHILSMCGSVVIKLRFKWGIGQCLWGLEECKKQTYRSRETQKDLCSGNVSHWGF